MITVRNLDNPLQRHGQQPSTVFRHVQPWQDLNVIRHAHQESSCDERQADHVYRQHEQLCSPEKVFLVEQDHLSLLCLIYTSPSPRD